MTDKVSTEKDIFADVFITKHKSSSGEEIHHHQGKKINSLKIGDLIFEDENLKAFAKKLVENYENVINETYNKKISPQQSQFAYDCARLISGKFKDNKPILIPAKAGFGKSTFIRTFLDAKVTYLGVVMTGSSKAYII